ncbi:MAG: hypothetical protein KA264_00325 [Crocinitomicaceae bacterium]|nr:hypothetical protein [Crocinitomicaceae bacterium]
MHLLRFVFQLVTILLFVFLQTACSTENNTLINRTYHRTTAKYNGYFNANELIKTSLETYQSNVKEDYYEILPVESVPSEKDLAGMLPSIDTAISKCTKVIRNHCMPSMEKPENKKVEYNTRIDENWNLIGKAYYLKRDYDISKKNFEYVQELFKNDKSTFVARIWIIKNLIATGKSNEAREAILELDGIIEKQEKEEAAMKKNFIGKVTSMFSKPDKHAPKKGPKFTKSLKAAYGFVKASYYIQESDYPKAIEALEKAVKLTKVKQERIRGYFILGQLYSKTNGQEKAKSFFSKVVSSASAPFDMQFNARVNRAFLGRDEKVKRELQKMLKDEKNTEYRDQLYYALAIITLQEQDKKQAIVLLHKSTYYSTTNKRQQAVSYEKLGTMAYQDKQYVKAQKYFDSCANVLPENYPNGDEIRKKANKLKRLVESVTIVDYEDSVLRIAGLSEKEREAYIKKTIKQIKENAARKQREDAARLREIQAKQLAEEQNNPSSNKWYWNNVQSKADGFSEFKKNWGSRENTDDWRRSERIVIAAMDTSSKNANQLETKQEIEDTLTVANLSKYLPLTASKRDSSLARLVAAEYEAGLIYKEQLNELKLASDCFQDVLNRSFVSTYNLLSSYQLYKINEGKDGKKANQQREYILTNYPSSDYANYLRDANFFVKKKEQEKKNEQAYLVVLEKYRNKEYTEVINLCTSALTNPDEQKLRDKYLLLKSLSLANTNENKQVIQPVLKEIVDMDSTTVEAKKAQELLQILAKGVSVFESTVFKKTYIYQFVENEPLWVLLFLDKNSNSNAAKNKIAAFNDANFDESTIIISSKLYEQDQSIILLKTFTQTEAEAYINKFKVDKKDVKEYSQLPIYMISQENLKVLFETHNLEEYKAFYSEFFQ